MAATYSGDPSSSDSDKVRFLLGDTNTSEAKLTDGEINFLLDEWYDPYLAAAEGAQQLSATAASWMSYTVDGTNLTMDQMQAKYSLLADQLRAQYRRLHRAAPWNAQANRGEYEAYELDESIQPALFKLGQHDDLDSGSGIASPEDLHGGRW